MNTKQFAERFLVTYKVSLADNLETYTKHLALMVRYNCNNLKLINICYCSEHLCEQLGIQAEKRRIKNLRNGLLLYFMETHQLMT
jgi:hypothetical protein